MTRTLFLTLALGGGVLLTGAVLGGAARSGRGAPAPAAGPTARVQVAAKTLRAPQPCADTFARHVLPHETRMRGGGARFFDSNGSGLGVGDLNGDGLQDAVLGNLAAPGTILWNLGPAPGGGPRFRAQPLEDGAAAATEIRDVKLVDVDADGHLDITLTHARGGVGVWLGDGSGGFRREWLSGARMPAYTMQWDDLAGTGQLNLVTASYDAALEAELGSTFLFASNGGVSVYGPVQREQGGLSVVGEKLSGAAQSLALLPLDLDGDGTRELVVGHDFGKPDQVWRRGGGRWVPIQPFSRTTRNTMGYASADLNGDDAPELYATDMKPDFADPADVARWMPLLERTYERLQYRDIQRAENTLQVRGKGGQYRNVAYDRNLDATGWSWSAQFGDLDHDGREDLYVVNGMIDEVVFSYLNGGELVEDNRAYRNLGGLKLRRQPGWGLDAPDSGRSMALADFTGDGRLDVLVNNVGGPATLFENRLCGGGGAIEVELRWPGTGNLRALGSVVRLRTPQGTQRRDVRSGSGYLTGTPSRVHFGLPAGAGARELEVVWPDGARSTVPAPAPQTRVTVTRLAAPALAGTP